MPHYTWTLFNYIPAHIFNQPVSQQQPNAFRDVAATMTAGRGSKPASERVKQGMAFDCQCGMVVGARWASVFHKLLEHFTNY